MWKVPLSDVDLGQNEIKAVTNVIKSKWLTMGEITQKFEKAFAEYLGVKHAFAVSSGTAELHLAHEVLELDAGDEVICPSFTFVATANSILYSGGAPIFADIKSLDDLNISPSNISEKISRRTKAITIVHYGGYPCDMDEIIEIAEEQNLHVIEDAAHAPGAEYKGKKCGAIGDIGCFSFFPNKNMTTGEGGMIVTNNDEFARKIKLLRSHGMTALTLDRYKGHAFSYDVVDLGYNYRMDEIGSSIGLVQLRKLNANNERRRHIVKRYVKELSRIPEIGVPFRSFHEASSCHIFPILLKNPDQRTGFMEELKKCGIQASIHYPPIHLFRFYRDKFGYKEGMLPITEDAGRREVTLPLYSTMKKKDVGYVIKNVKKSIEKLR